MKAIVFDRSLTGDMDQKTAIVFIPYDRTSKSDTKRNLKYVYFIHFSLHSKTRLCLYE